jgi:hypothetical protein
MIEKKCMGSDQSKTAAQEQVEETQKIVVFQQNGSGEKKIEGIRRYGNSRFTIEIVSIDETLPGVIDDARKYIPKDIRADLVLDFFKHPDLSQDLAEVCRDKKIPAVASGKKLRVKGVLTPPT